MEAVTEQDIEEVLTENGDDEDESEETAARGRSKKPKKRISYGSSLILDKFANTPTRKHTVRIDTKLLAEAESEDPKKRKADAAEALRKIVATVGKRGEPGEHVRCVVSVAMLTEGWDANNVTQVLGIRAFGSQLLCEQVVGRGLRRMDYNNFDEQGRFKPEYVDVYGIPFSVIPFKGRPIKHKEDEDRPVNHVRALPERAQVMEMRFPVVEGYVFALKKNLIRAKWTGWKSPRLSPIGRQLQPSSHRLWATARGMRHKAAGLASSSTIGRPSTPARIFRPSSLRLRSVSWLRWRSTPPMARTSSGACYDCNHVTSCSRRSIVTSKTT